MSAKQREISDRGLAVIILFGGIVCLNMVLTIIYGIISRGDVEKVNLLIFLILVSALIFGAGSLIWGARRLWLLRAKSK